ncbi:hypothetical protein GC207_13590 [bacterium]|nr:hypothetical protein [bacterium]
MDTNGHEEEGVHGVNRPTTEARLEYKPEGVLNMTVPGEVPVDRDQDEAQRELRPINEGKKRHGRKAKEA